MQGFLDSFKPSQATKKRTNSDLLKARRLGGLGKRKLPDADTPAESSRKRTKPDSETSHAVLTIESEETTANLVTIETSSQAPAVTPSRMKFCMRYDYNGNRVYTEDPDQTDLMTPDEAMSLPPGVIGIMERAKFVTQYRKEKAAEAARQAQEQAEKEAETQAASAADGQQDASTADAQLENDQSHISRSGRGLHARTPTRWGMGSILGGAKKVFSSIRGTPAGPTVIPTSTTSNAGPAQAGVKESSGNVVTPSASTQDTYQHAHTEPPPTGHLNNLSSPTTDENQAQQGQADESLIASNTSFTTGERREGIQKKKGKVSRMTKDEFFSTYEKEIEEKVARRVIAEMEAERAATPGQKRKRISPTRIPNPVGCSYGMDLDFFGNDSESEDEPPQTPDDSPSARPTKRTRLSFDQPSTPPRQIIGDPHHATPYTGTVFADPKRNLFTAPKPKVSQPEVASTPSRTFVVPEDSDSDSASENEATTTAIKKGKAKQVHFSDIPIDGPSITTSDRASSSEPPKSAMKGSSKLTESWQQPPPPRPYPSHAALPPTSTTGDTEALARARSQALRYTPVKPSGLRAASRLSSSTIGTPSDIGDGDEPLFVQEAISGDEPLFVSEAVPGDEVVENSGGIANQGQIESNPPQAVLSEISSNDAVENNGGIANQEHIGSNLLPQVVLGEISGNENTPIEKKVTVAVELGEIDPMVATALASISDANLLPYQFPSSGFSEDDMDPVVKAHLDATWGQADEERAYQVFERELREWRALQPSPTSSNIQPLAH